MGYLFLDKQTEARLNGTLPQFQKRMASYLVKQPNVSQLVGFHVDELDSAYGMCPCGHGLVVAYAEEPRYFYEQVRYYPKIICPYCQQMFSAQVQLLSPKTAMDPAVAVLLVDKTGQRISLPVRPKLSWKMLSW